MRPIGDFKEELEILSDELIDAGKQAAEDLSDRVETAKEKLGIPFDNEQDQNQVEPAETEEEVQDVLDKVYRESKTLGPVLENYLGIDIIKNIKIKPSSKARSGDKK